METQFPSERSIHTDPETGATVIQWTEHPCTNQHLYFTSASVTSDDRWLIFISDRNGNPNLYAIDRNSGIIHRLSNNTSGLLRSYVYPQGGLCGLSKASPCLDPFRNRIFYIRDDRVYAVRLNDPQAVENEICKLPSKWYGGFTHLSPDGRTFCVPCTDPQAFVDEARTQWDQLRKVPVRMKKDGLSTRIYLVDAATGDARIAAEVPFWVTHVQFDPAGTGRIIFNQEGLGEGNGGPLPDRIWCLEPDGSFRPIAPELPGEWRSHENWAQDGSSVVYHGAHGEQTFIASRTWDGKLIRETSLDRIKFVHATGSVDGRHLFVDRTDGFISAIDPGTTGARLTNLCRHDTSFAEQDSHAHPITTPSGKSLIFTSNRSGNCNVYEVLLPADIIGVMEEGEQAGEHDCQRTEIPTL